MAYASQAWVKTLISKVLKKAKDEGKLKNDIYSTNEQVIGKWIDGKPIYRRVVSTTLPTIKDGSIVSVTIPFDYHVDNTVNIIGNCKINNSDIPLNSAWYVAPTTYFLRGFYSIKDKNITIQCNREIFSDYKVNVAIEYTKTTD